MVFFPASDLTSEVTSLSNGACFKTHGGIYHEDSISYYELVDNGQVGIQGLPFSDLFHINV